MGAPLGVKDLIQAGKNEVPEDYLQPSDTRHLHDEDENVDIPVVDLRDPEAISKVHKACQEWGFFQVTGHGFPLELMNQLSQFVHEFFDLPSEERMPYYSTDVSKTFRYATSFNPTIEPVKLWSDFIYHVCPANDEELPQILNYLDISRNYIKEIEALAKCILGIFNTCLGLETGTLEKIFGNLPRHAMRMNYYPPCPSPGSVYGLKGHSDPGGFTILQQDPGVQGLQVLYKEKWVPVKAIPGAFVINIADQMQILTNGRYKSVEHRAMVNSTKTRVSVASFYSPNGETFVAPVKELLIGDETPKFKGCKFSEYLHSFFTTALDGKTALAKAT